MAGTKLKEDDLSDAMRLTLEEYVKHRFLETPKAVKKSLDLEGNHNARAHLEVFYRSEYYRERSDDLEGMLVYCYRNLAAAKSVLQFLAEEGAIDDEQIREMWEKSLEEQGQITGVPVELGWKK